jgi:hypothetical protein
VPARSTMATISGTGRSASRDARNRDGCAVRARISPLTLLQMSDHNVSPGVWTAAYNGSRQGWSAAADRPTRVMSSLGHRLASRPAFEAGNTLKDNPGPSCKRNSLTDSLEP